MERLRLKNTIHTLKNGANSLPPGSLDYGANNRYRELLQTYLDREHPLHIRRTLDQFYYFNLAGEEMEYRDTHQTITEFFESLQDEGIKAENFPILMVDQLWLWVVRDGE
jgi:hypothetical protein